MDNVQAIILALLQGFTEFLPISSSAHLILVPRLLGWDDQGLAFDVAVHIGTLIAVMFYFRQDLLRLAGAWFQSCAGQPQSVDARLAWMLIWATVPIVLVGFFMHDVIEGALRSPLVIAVTTIGFGVLLWLADLRGRKVRTIESLGIADAILIGMSQILALVPGTSRSGITMTAALAMGLTRSDAARFSFLLSIPVIIAAGGFETLNLVQQPDAVNWTLMLLGTLVAAVSAWVCIYFFMHLIERIGMWPFVVYRLLLGVLLLWVFV